MSSSTNKVPFLVVSSSPYMRGILKFVLEAYLHTEVKELESEETALTFLKNLDPQPSMIVYDYRPNAYLLEDFVGHLKAHSKNVHIIILVDKVREEGEVLLKDARQIKLMDESGLPENLIEEAKRTFQHTDMINKDEYCRIDVNFLSILDGINKNLFIKIGTDKYIKIFNENDNTNKLDLHKYKAKGIDYLFLNRTTAEWVLGQIQKQIDIFLRSNNFRFVLRGASESPEKRFENKILRIADEVHIDRDFKESIDRTVERIRAAVEKEPSVEILIKNLKEKKDEQAFFNQRLNLMSLMTCVLAKQLDWISKTTMDKLIYASVVSDITLAVRPELQSLKNMSDFERVKDKFSPEEQKIFLNHPKDAANLIKHYFKTAPPDTDAICLQHHEMPDGSGFPLGLKADKIAPLSALFIVANDFCYYFLKDEDPSMDDFLLKCHSRYDFVNFRKVVQALVKLRRR